MAATTIDRVTWTDDNGSGTTGTIINNAVKNSDFYQKIDDLLSGVRANPLVFGGAISIEGGQIVFPGTQAASAGVNTLDDYEEGTFTPTIESAGGGAATYTTQLGRYVKVGKRVDIWIDVTLATKGSLAAGHVRVAGLPFTAHSVLIMSVANGYWAAMTTNITNMLGHVAPSGTRIDVYHTTGTAVAAPNATQVSDISATQRVAFGGSYEASA